MRIGIVTICDYQNYGNRLQNFALQEYLRSHGLDVVTIANTPKKGPVVRKSIWGRFGHSILGILTANPVVYRKIFQRLFRSSKLEELQFKKHEKFVAFTRTYISETAFVVSEQNLPNNLGEMFDYFVVGSDQVWNPEFRKGSSVDFLTFAPKEKRFSYAASFGLTNLPGEFVDSYRSWLSEMSNISVREHAGAVIVEQLIGKKVQVSIDPTLLLSREDWSRFAAKSSARPQSKYLLCYFLGKKSNEVNRAIKKIASERNLEIVSLADVRSPRYYTVDPREFVDLVSGCDLFLTDSFHGVVFSIIFEKSFYVFNRSGQHSDMGSRIDTLLTTFQLSANRWDQSKKVSQQAEYNTSHVNKTLDLERMNTEAYFTRVLGSSFQTRIVKT